MKINAILETLNEAIEWKNTEISALKYQLENAQKVAEEAEAKCKEVQEATYAHLKMQEKQHKEEVELLESRIIYLEGKLNPNGPTGEKEKENGSK